jgi:phosphoserine phosphatase
MKLEPQMKLALFDLDQTLLPLDSDQSWGEFTLGLGWVDEASFRQRNNAFYADYNAGCLDIHEYVRFATRSMRERGMEEAQAAHQLFMQKIIQPAIKPAALELVAQHRAKGETLVMVTATNEFVTGPIAKLSAWMCCSRSSSSATPTAISLARLLACPVCAKAK